MGHGNIDRFGIKRIDEFMDDNDLDIIIRSHECVMNGVEKFGDTNLYTVFSCTNYGGITNNKACLMMFHNRTRELIVK